MATVKLSTSRLHNATAVSSSYTYGDTVTITVTADPGYIFTTSNPPKIGWTNKAFSYKERQCTLSDDRKTGTVQVGTSIIYLDGSGDNQYCTIDVEGNPEQSTAKIYTVTKNFTHCSSSVIPNSIEENTQFNWSIWADDGYVFKEGSVTTNIGEVHFNAEYPNSVNVVGTATGNITVTATADLPAPTVKTVNIVTGTVEHCSYTPKTANYGDTVTITVTGDDGYAFTTNTPYVEYTDTDYSQSQHNFTLNEDKKTGTVTVHTNEIEESSLEIEVYATATAIPIIVTHTVTKTLTNCTGDIPSTIQDGSQFTWTLTPNEGYEFKDGSVTSSIGNVSITSNSATITGSATGDITIQATATEIVKTVNIITGTVENCSYAPKTANYKDTVTITITSDSGYAFTTQTPYVEYTASQGYQEQHNFKLNEDKTSGTVSVDTNDVDATKLEIEVYATATYQQGTTVSEMYTVYSVSPSDLQAVSNKRFTNVSGSDAYNEQLITYINDLYRLPLAFKDLPTQALMLKNETVVSSAHVIPNVTYTYDLGTVTLPKKYGNSNDYNNVYDVMLPYYGVYTLDNAKALDTPIKIQAIIDIISGSCTYIFSRDGHAIDSVRTNVKENLPYMTRDMQQLGSLSTVTMFEVEPSITCYYHDITNAYVNKDVNDTVSNLTYFKADNIIHCSGISNKYKNLILNKLREGVFTNEL